MRKIHPSDSVGNIYLNKKESQIIRLYEKEKMDYYMKLREMEKKEKEKEDNLTGKKNISSSLDNTKMNSYLKNNENFNNDKTNRKEYVPFTIDKKILGKIRYV